MCVCVCACVCVCGERERERETERDRDRDRDTERVFERKVDDVPESAFASFAFVLFSVSYIFPFFREFCKFWSW